MNQRDMQIEQYIRGRMPERTRREFERQMAADPALHRSVQAEQAIIETLRRDALANAAETSTEVPALLSAKLGMTSAAGGLPQIAGIGVLGAIFGTKVGITVLSIVGAVGIVLGVLLIAPLFNDRQSDERANRIDVRNERSLPAAESRQGGNPNRASTPVAEGEGNGTASSPASLPSVTEGKTALRDQSPSSAGTERERKAQASLSTAPLNSKEEGSAETTPKTPAQQMLEQLQREESTRQTPRIKKGSAEVQVDIDN